MKRIATTVLALTLGMAISTTAGAASKLFPGASCLPAIANTNTTSGYYRNENGMSNSDTGSSRVVVCPVFEDSSVNESLRLWYNDTSSAANLYCYAYTRIPGSGVTYSDPRYSCGTAGGCATDSDPSYSSTGTVYFDFSGTNWDGAVCTIGKASSGGQIAIQSLIVNY